ncbi:MAG: right-handed parallel beta-helix repeat-containing protein [Victivallales bacterium]|nr:right-handed parallel beta-helix repeat-containing protein [Victivallales bacterium]
MNIVDFGAVADGATVNTKAIQTAIDACAAVGGGTVTVPAGVFVTGTIWLRSHVELHLEMGALLKASTNLADYCATDSYEQNSFSQAEQWNGAHLIVALEQEDVALTGPGTIDGGGEFFFEDEIHNVFGHFFVWSDGFRMARDKRSLRPGQMIVFCECDNVRISNLSLRNSPCWTVFLHGCTDAIVTGLIIRNPSVNGNTDGIDIDCCDGVTVSDCIIHTGDDAITVRGNPRKLKNKRACENISITNCVLDCTVSGFRVGVGDGAIRHVAISNITMKRVAYGFLIQSAYKEPSRGTDISDVTISNIQLHRCAYPIRILSGAPSSTATIRDMHIEGIHGQCCASCEFVSGDRAVLRNLTLRNVDLTVVASPVKLLAPEDYPQNLFLFRRVKDVTLESVRVTWDEGADPTWRRAVCQENSSVDLLPSCSIPEPPAAKSTLSTKAHAH